MVFLLMILYHFSVSCCPLTAQSHCHVF
jgi:hypothetical protein